MATTLGLLGLGGCATISQSSTQDITVLAYDLRDRPVTGMTCTLSNGAGEARFSTPADKVTVRRSYTALEIECTRDGDVAKGTVLARRENLEQALVPFGWVAVGVDHLTGHLYAYPDLVRLRVGQHLRYEFSREARAAGVIATLSDGSVMTDLQGPPPRTEALPAAAAAGAPASATKAVRARSGPAPGPTTAQSAKTPAPAARKAPLTW